MKRKQLIIGALGILVMAGVAIATATQLGVIGTLPFAPTAPSQAPAFSVTPIQDNSSGFSAQFDEFWDQGIDIYQWQSNVSRVSAAKIYVDQQQLVLTYPDELTVTQVYDQVYLYAGRLQLRDDFVLETQISGLTTQSGRAALEFWSGDEQDMLISIGWEKSSGESRVRGLVSENNQFVLETPSNSVAADKLSLRISRINGIIWFDYVIDDQVTRLGDVYPDVYTGTGVIRLSVSPLTPNQPVEAKFDNLLGTINVLEIRN